MTVQPLIYRFRDEVSGLESRATETRRGWAVTLRDLDSGERLPSVRIYKRHEVQRAIVYARRIVGASCCVVTW